MSVYVDGFAIPVPKETLADDRRVAPRLGRVMAGPLMADLRPKGMPLDGRNMFLGWLQRDRQAVRPGCQCPPSLRQDWPGVPR
jgi:uncharacterized protein YbaA (DUF1428 family)